MAVAFVQKVTSSPDVWFSASPAVSPSFTPTAGNLLLAYGATFTGGGTLTFSGMSMLTPPGNYDDTAGDTHALGYKTAAGGSQTLTLTASATCVGFAWEYSGAGTPTSTAGVLRSSVTTVNGTAMTPAVGDVILAICFDIGGGSSAIAGVGGTNRDSGSNANQYCVQEYAGTGSPITPQFSSTGSSSFVVMQFLIPASGGASPVVPSVGSQVIGGNAPVRILGLGRVPTVGALALAGIAPTRIMGTVSVPTVGALALAGIAPSVTRADSRVPTVGALVLSGNAPTIAVSGSVTRQPSTGALVFSGAAPTLDLTLPAPLPGALALSGGTPGIAISIARQPTVGALSITGNAPSVTRQTVISPSTATMALSGQLAVVSRQTVPAAGSLSLAGLSANLTYQLYRQPVTAALALTGLTPSVTVSAAGTAQPLVGSLALLGIAPAVTQPDAESRVAD